MCFNTSHVTLYPYDRIDSYRVIHVSIHLMLLFIAFASSSMFSIVGFQYISCYSLSTQKQFMKLGMLRFNTSHVTLYPGSGTAWATTKMFQYISCYSLSSFPHVSIFLLTPFQYISCYSLSRRELQEIYSYYVSIHLMLLFI